MTINLFQTPEYKTLIKEHIEKSIAYLFSKDQEFAIACNIKHVTFNPELPNDIAESFQETVLFILSGYAYETSRLEKEYFIFNAGFGSEGFESTVTVPLLAIKQLIVGDHPIVFNLVELEEERKVSPENSMEALMNNPENKKLLKKKKL